jgi:hypothetical protein
MGAVVAPDRAPEVVELRASGLLVWEAAVAADGAGFRVAWSESDGRTATLYTLPVGAAGDRGDPVAAVAVRSVVGSPSLAARPGGFLLAWAGRGSLTGKAQALRLDGSGTPEAAPLWLGDGVCIAAASHAGRDIAVWTSIADGTSEVRIGEVAQPAARTVVVMRTAGEACFPAIATGESGLVLLWEALAHGVYAAPFDPDLWRPGAFKLVAPDGHYPAPALSAAGGLLVVTGTAPEGRARRVYGRILGASLDPAGDLFEIAR